MTKKTILSFGLVASLFAAAPAQAQLLKSLKNTVKSTIQEATQKGKAEAEAEVKEQVEAVAPKEVPQFNWYLEDGKYQNIYEKTRPTVDMKDPFYRKQYSAYINCLKLFMRIDDQIWFEQLGESNKYIPTMELFLYPWSKAFVENPTDEIALVDLARCLMFMNEPARRLLKMELGREGIISSSENQMFYWRSGSDYNTELEKRMEGVCKIMIQNYSVEQIAEQVNERYKFARQAFENPNDRPFQALIDDLSYPYQAKAIKEQVLEKHPDYDRNADYVRDIKMHEAWFDNTRTQIHSYCKAITAAAKPVPQGVQLDAATMQKAVAAAKDIVGADKFVKVIPLSKEWRAFKNPNYPYQVMHRSIPCVIVYKIGDKNYWAEYDLKRIEGHNELSMMLGMGAGPVPVKE